MITAFRIIWRAIKTWWQEIAVLTLVNVAWLILQPLIITGPPATATVYAVARKVVDDEYVDFKFVWDSFRQMFFSAWKWGIVNLIIALITFLNFSAYREAPGLGWTILRTSWTIIAIIWFSANLFYWPLWIAQENRALRNTLRNCLVILIREPGTSFTIAVFSAIFIVISIITTIPFGIFMIMWLALIAIIALDEMLPKIPTVDEDDETE
jgi:uncharacterized membrane protein YesL